MVFSDKLALPPLSTTLQADFLPAEVLFALTEVTPKTASNLLGPASRIKRTQVFLINK